MAVFPQASVLFNTDPNWTAAQARVEFEQWLESTRQLPGAAETAVYTIANGQITPTRAAVVVDTEGGAPADDLTTIAPTNMHAGAVIMLRAANSWRTVTVKHGTGVGGITLLGGVDCALSTTHWLMLCRVGDAWAEMPPLRAAQAQQAATASDMAAGHVLAGKTTAEGVRGAIAAPSPNVGKYKSAYRTGATEQPLAACTWSDVKRGATPAIVGNLEATTDPGTGLLALQVPESGVYSVHVWVTIVSSTQGGVLAGIGKNGVVVDQLGYLPIDSFASSQPNCTRVMALSAKDVVSVKAYSTLAATITPYDAGIELVRIR